MILCLYGFIDLLCPQILSSRRSVVTSFGGLSFRSNVWRCSFSFSKCSNATKKTAWKFWTCSFAQLCLDLMARQETLSHIFALNRSAISANFSKQFHPYQVTNSHRSLVLDYDNVLTMSLRRPRNWSWIHCGDCREVHAIRKICSQPDVLCAECWKSHSNWSWNCWNVLEGQCL